jgi:CHAT domain-containing protein/tetratricopeptide (TPR) repeat protein
MTKYSIADLDEWGARKERFFREGNYREALACAQQTLKIAEVLLSPADLRVATYYEHIGNFQRILCLYQEAETNLLHAVKLMEANEEADSQGLYTAQERLARLYQDLGRYKEAEELFRRTLKMIIEKYGCSHLNIPNLLNSLGVVLFQQGRFQEAEERYKSSINNWQVLKGPDYHKTAIPILNLGECYLTMGKYPEAEKYIDRGLKIKLESLPSDHHSLAPFYNNLGELYYARGDYKRSLDYYDKALKIDLRTFGEEHPRIIKSFNGKAMTLNTLGHYEQAESIYLKVLKIYEKIYDGDHPDIANTRNNLALIYEAIGDYERADLYIRKALESKVNFVGPDHHDLAVYHTNLANICIRKEDYPQALEHCEKARRILEQKVGPDSPKLVYLHNTMAHIHKKREKFKDAELCYKKSIELYERSSPSDPAGLSMVWYNLAELYQDENDYTMAEKCLKRSIRIMEDGTSPEHPDLIQPLLSLAMLRTASGNYLSAFSLFRRILFLQENHIDMVFTFTGEEQKLTFINFMSDVYLIALSAVLQYMTDENSEAVVFAFETILRRKGIVLDAEAHMNKMLHMPGDEPLRKPLEERSRKLSRLSQLVGPSLAGAADSTASTDHGSEMKTLREEIEVLERELKKKIPRESPLLQQTGVTLPDVAKHIPDRTALLEFVKIRDYDFSPGKKTWGLTRYIVFIVKQSGSISMVDLGNAAAIDPCIQEVLGAILIRHEKTKEILAELCTLIWAPLSTYLTGIERLIISPDSYINLVPFAALIDRSGNYLVEKYTISYVTGSQQIIPAPPKKYNREYQLVMVADPDFNSGEALPGTSGSDHRSGRPPKRYERLGGTKQERIKIPPLVPGQNDRKKVITGKNATKNAVLNVVNPRILHLATHSEVSVDDMNAFVTKPLTPEEFSEELIPSLKTMFQPVPGKKTGTSKRLRSLAQTWLALAGANYSNPEAGDTTGLLTGLEVTGMQLQGTELVVLASCNTGFGEFMPSEGIVGLRRAFALAGAKNLVMSLWKVDDEYTMKQMEMFYRNVREMPPAEALRKAQLHTIKELEKDHKESPFFWAPFIIQGGQSLTTLIYDDSGKKKDMVVR